jgi:hypothetical protein
MRTFRYQDLDGVHTITDEEIIATRYEKWAAMVLECRPDLAHMISHEECIADFVCVHWAYEVFG